MGYSIGPQYFEFGPYYDRVSQIRRRVSLITTLNTSHDLNNFVDYDEGGYTYPFGLYGWASGAPTNAPNSYSNMLYIRDANQPIQFVFGSAYTGRAYIRRRNSETWGSWTQI